jgi:hypothetical protein
MDISNIAPLRKFSTFVKPYKRFTPALFFAGGFTWDSLTLQRIDNIVDNVILLGYFLLLSLLIVLMNLTLYEKIKKPILVKFSGWYPMGIQFFFGGLFSSYVIFYFHSASMTGTSVFLFILVGLLVANEFLENRLSNIHLLMSLYFLVAFSFFIFFIPVISGYMSHITFLSGGFLALFCTVGLIFFFYKKGTFRDFRQYSITCALICFAFLGMNMLYIMNWIPPVPLSVKHSGIYHKVQREGDAYALSFEKPKWYVFWRKYDVVYNHHENDKVYCFSSIFAPADLKKNVLHQWQLYSKQKKEWITTDKLSYEITGGRGAGFRGYTFKKNISPGKWRVEVKTGDGLLLGRVSFRINEAKEGISEMKTLYF